MNTNIVAVHVSVITVCSVFSARIVLFTVE